MKKLAILLLCFLLFPSAALAKGPDPIAIYVNGRELFTEEAAPTIRYNRTFLPLRAVTEELGYTVAWDGDKKEVTLTKGDSAVVMTIGKKSYRLGGKAAAMDVAPYLEKNHTFIPVRYLGQATRLPVKWLPKERIVTVGSYPQKDTLASERIYVKDVDMSFVLPKDVAISYKPIGKSLCFYEKFNDDAGGDGFLFSLSRVENPRTEWNNWPVILTYKDGLYYGADFRGDPAMIQDEVLKSKFEKAHDRIDDILMTVRVGK